MTEQKVTMSKRDKAKASISTIETKHYTVGDVVEIFCDHNNKEGNRMRDWLQGVVVQADEKMVAVQFNQDVYLTDGWMVPDRVLWTQHFSATIRPATRRRRR
jgi:ribosomal protein L21E